MKYGCVHSLYKKSSFFSSAGVKGWVELSLWHHVATTSCLPIPYHIPEADEVPNSGISGYNGYSGYTLP